MEITLEQVELVKDRTGCTYAEAKAALEAAGGSVVDAIINVEGKANAEYSRVDGESLKDSPLFYKMKKLVEKGNVSRILISKNGKTVVNFPVTVGVVGTVLVPWGAILGMVAAMGTQCSIDFVNDKGKVIDIDGKVTGVYDKAKGLAVKGVKVIEKIENNETVEALLTTLDGFAKKAGKSVKELINDAADSYHHKDADEILDEELKDEEL